MLTVPDLPEWDETSRMELRTAAHSLPGRPDWKLVRAWSTRGCRVVDDRDLYAFPSMKVGGRRYTCRPWLEAWAAFVARLRADHARRQVERVERCKAAARR